MYQPEMGDALIRCLYRIKRAHLKPMTQVLEELLVIGLKATASAEICCVCRKEGNNDCLNCYLKKEAVYDQV